MDSCNSYSHLTSYLNLQVPRSAELVEKKLIILNNFTGIRIGSQLIAIYNLKLATRLPTLPHQNINKHTSSSQDTGAGLLGNVKSSHCQFRYVVQPNIIGHGSDNHCNQTLASGLLHVTHQAGEGDRRAVDTAHKQPPQDNGVELGICTPGQVSVQLSTKTVQVMDESGRRVFLF